jgi:hypothetical protein
MGRFGVTFWPLVSINSLNGHPKQVLEGNRHETRRIEPPATHTTGGSTEETGTSLLTTADSETGDA